jgi:hypothetical protein
MGKFNTLIYNDDSADNWLHKRYYYAGSNYRFHSFNIALNILVQKYSCPVIIETGCQRIEEDLGGGMSTSIFGEYCARYGGKLYTVDLYQDHLDVCKDCTKPYAHNIEYILSDSVTWLKKSQGIQADLIYLDSLDYAVSLDGTRSTDTAGEIASQKHCLDEFLAAERSGKLKPTTMILIDDNQLPGGGKPKMLKKHLKNKGWTCLIDFQQSLWVREL